MTILLDENCACMYDYSGDESAHVYVRIWVRDCLFSSGNNAWARKGFKDGNGIKISKSLNFSKLLKANFF